MEPGGSEAVVKPETPYKMPTHNDWTPLATTYHPLQAGSIDGTDTVPHDKGVVRAVLSRYKPNKQAYGDPMKTLFVGRLNKDTTEETVLKSFLRFGGIKHCRLVRDFVTGFSRRYAFVEFDSERDCRRAWRDGMRMCIDGSTVIVEYEHARNLKGWKPRRLGGGFGGCKESGQLRFGGRERPFRRPLPLHHSNDKDKPQNNRRFGPNQMYRSNEEGKARFGQNRQSWDYRRR